MPRQFSLPGGDADLIFLRRRPVNEEPDVVVSFPGDHLGRKEFLRGPGFGIPHPANPEGFLPDPPGRGAGILAEFQVRRRYGPSFPVIPPAIGVQAGERFPPRVVRILPEEDLAVACDEQVGADAHPAGRQLLKSRGRGVPHQPQERTGAGHVRGTARTEKRIPSRRTRDRDEGPPGAECAPKRLRSGPEPAGWLVPTDRGKRTHKRPFLAVDLHGSEVVFRKFLAAATFY